MALSGSYDWSWNGRQIITEALELLGIVSIGESISNAYLVACLRSLNAMIKAWGVEDGIALWKDVEAALFLEYEGYEYDIGPSGDHVTDSWVKTEIATAASSGDSTITVDSDTGILDGDYIGVELDDYSLQWTTVNGTPSSNVVTLTDVLTDDVAVDNHVYTYTTKLQRPLNIVEARLRSPTTDDDHEGDLHVKNRVDYMAVANKEDTGTAELVYYHPVRTNGKLYVWPACDDVQKYIKFTASIQIEDFDALGNDPDFSSEWMLALSWNLATIVAPKFGKETSDKFEMKALGFKNKASITSRKSTWRPTGLTAGPVQSRYTQGVTPKG